MNLIYLFADQWRRDAMGIYDPNVITPNLDSLAQEGVLFDRAYSSCPLCSPNRACLLTGKAPGATNVFTNCKPDVDCHLKEDTMCVSDLLKREGYSTGYIGKWHLDRPDGRGGWDAYTPPGRKRHGFDFWYSYGTFNDHMHPHYWDTEGNYTEIDQWSPEHETDTAISFLERNKDKPFALFVSFNPPHSPYDAVPKKYEDMYAGLERKITAWSKAPENAGDPIPDGLDVAVATRQYYAAVTGIDENIGRITKWLKENGLYEDTYIMISADHGDMMGDHQLMAKHIWYEGSIGIPLIVSGGGLKHQRTRELISAEDQTATILGLLGIVIPECMDGMDFSPLVRGEKFTGHQSIMTMAFPNTQKRIDEYTAHGLNFMDYGWRCIVTERYKMVVNRGQQYGMESYTCLYDMQQDPGENVSINDPEIMGRMKEELRYWCERNGDHFVC